MERNRTRRPMRREMRPRVCRFCENKVNYIDFLEPELLAKFQTENGKILPSRVTGTCKIHQKMLCAAIKRARILALSL